jgi:hypothetical protein
MHSFPMWEKINFLCGRGLSNQCINTHLSKLMPIMHFTIQQANKYYDILWTTPNTVFMGKYWGNAKCIPNVHIIFQHHPLFFYVPWHHSFCHGCTKHHYNQTHNKNIIFHLLTNGFATINYYYFMDIFINK